MSNHPDSSAARAREHAAPKARPGHGTRMRSPLFRGSPGPDGHVGGGTNLTRETDTLRRVRIRAAAIFFLAAVALGFLRDRLLGGTSFWPLQAAVMSAMAATIALLAERIAISTRFLKGAEYAVFGLMACYLAVRQYESAVEASRIDDATGLPAATNDAVLRTALLLVAYGMLIPNTWRQALRVVACIAIIPAFIEAILVIAHPGVRHAVGKAATLDRLTSNFMLLIIAACLSVYGPYVFHSLRREAFDAKQLNQYRLLKQLGVGGMGVVYLAEHALLKRACALKLIRPEAAGDAIALGRFEREVHSTARLSHPNIIEIFDYGQTDNGTFYYVMEYLRGLNLEDLLKRHGPLPAGRVIFLLRQACEALAEAHTAGLVHRDIKPANLFVARSGRRFDLLKVVDFGLVRPFAPAEGSELTLQGRTPGTPQFMAPEQVRGAKSLDGRCDLYALGGIAYNLITGRPPFQSNSVREIMMAQVRDPVVPPSQVRHDVPVDLEQVILRCLAKDPDDRYPDADALELALAACESVGEWDGSKASRWWNEFEADAIVEPGPSDPTDEESSVR